MADPAPPQDATIAAEKPIATPALFEPGDKPLDFMWRYCLRELDRAEGTLALRRLDQAAMGKTVDKDLLDAIKYIERDVWTLTKMRDFLRRVHLNRKEIEYVLKTGVE